MKFASSTTSTNLLHDAQDLERRFPRQKIDLSNGETLSYVDCPLGSKHTLLVVPGYGCDSIYMAYTLAQYAAFQDHRIIGVDPRGYGESTQHAENWSHEENAQDMHLFLDQILPQNNKQIMVMGYSTGAGTAAWLALQYPEKVQAVWMVSGIPLNGLRIPMIHNNKPTGRLVQSKEDAQQFAKTVMAPNHNPDIHVFRKDQGTICKNGIDTLPPSDDYLFQIYHKGALSHRARAPALYANTIFNITPIVTPTTPPNTTALSSQLACPMIVLHGAMDYFVSVHQVRSVTQLAMAERWARRKLLSYYEIPECGHMFMYDNPSGFQETYLRALHEQILDSKASGNNNNNKRASL